MSEPAGPVVTSEPIAPPEVARVASHLALWLEQHVAPELAKAKADAARALAYAQAHAANADAMAGLLVKIISAADPAAGIVLAALAPEAQRVLTETERLVAEFAGPQM
jgi:hypothetical protein